MICGAMISLARDDVGACGVEELLLVENKSREALHSSVLIYENIALVFGKPAGKQGIQTGGWMRSILFIVGHLVSFSCLSERCVFESAVILSLLSASAKVG